VSLQYQVSCQHSLAHLLPAIWLACQILNLSDPPIWWPTRMLQGALTGRKAHKKGCAPLLLWCCCVCAGVPTALRFMPGLLDAVKGAVAREAAQLLDKLAFVASKVS